MNRTPHILNRLARSKWLVRAAAAVLLYALLGFLLLPVIIKWQMLKRLPAITHRSVAVQQVKLNPFALSLTIRGFSLNEPDGDEFAGFAELYVNLELVSVFKRGLVFKEIRLLQPAGHIVLKPDGSFNFANLAGPPAAPPKPRSRPPLIQVADLTVTNGAISFTDRRRPVPFQRQYQPINLHLANFTTRPSPGSPYVIFASTPDGEMFSWVGTFSLVPLRSDGTFKLADLQIPKYAPYLDDFARVNVRDGRVSLEAGYHFAVTNDQLQLDIARAQFHLRDLVLQSPDTSNTFLTVPLFAINDIEASLEHQTARIRSITSTGAFFQARCHPDGTIDPIALLKPRPNKPATPAPPATTAPATPPPRRDWKFNLDDINLDDCNALIEDQRHAKPMQLSLKHLGFGLSGLAWDSLSNALQIAEVKLRGFDAIATILPANDTNTTTDATATTAANAPATPPEPAPPSGTAPPPHLAGGPLVRIGAVTFEDTAFHFTDRSLTPTATVRIENFNGTIQELSSALNTVATVDFHGKVNGAAPFAITGQINPLATDLFVNLTVSLADASLLPGTPYAAKYVGYPLEKGALSLDLRYSVTQRELKAQNNVRVDQLTLGPSSHSPDATQLPVKLVIALLQDRHGVISLNVPVTGRLDDPKFKLAPLIWQVFMNVITKAATKPFALLGSLFGGGEDLSFIAFEPGRPGFAPGESAKLDALAKALYERPSLSLEIAGSVDPAKDRDALAHLKLELQLKELRLQELTTAGQKPPPVEALRLEPAERDRLLKLAYGEAAGLISRRTSASREAAVMSHLLTRQNFGPLRGAPGAAGAGAATPAKPLTLADMETALLARIEITPANLQTLMQDRANQVKNYLTQSGQVPPDRLSIAAPKPVDPSFQGQCRVDLKLQ